MSECVTHHICACNKTKLQAATDTIVDIGKQLAVAQQQIAELITQRDNLITSTSLLRAKLDKSDDMLSFYKAEWEHAKDQLAAVRAAEGKP
jgi:chromosome segregation ATPase